MNTPLALERSVRTAASVSRRLRPNTCLVHTRVCVRGCRRQRGRNGLWQLPMVSVHSNMTLKSMYGLDGDPKLSIASHDVRSRAASRATRPELALEMRHLRTCTVSMQSTLQCLEIASNGTFSRNCRQITLICTSAAIGWMLCCVSCPL